MRLLFAGTPAVAVPSLRLLLDHPRHEVVGVLSRPAARAGRGRHEQLSPVAELAGQAGLPVLSPARTTDPELIAAIAELGVECAPVVAYGALLREPALGAPPHGWVNLHMSVLPAWRGAAPVQHAIWHGDEISGASTFRIGPGLDDGPVYGVVTERVRPRDTAGELLERLAEAGATLLAATLDGIADGALAPQPQSEDGVSLAPKLTVQDARVDFGEPAIAVDRRIRACTPSPGPWTEVAGIRLKLGPVDLVEDVSLPPAELRVDRREVLVGTASTAVRLGTVQPPGRRPMPAADWARGAHLPAHSRCE